MAIYKQKNVPFANPSKMKKKAHLPDIELRRGLERKQ